MAKKTAPPYSDGDHLEAPASSSSPVKKARYVSVATRCMLWGLAAGRCEFVGCNKLLLEHHVTAKRVNLAEFAHIVAFSEDGPRGGEETRPTDIHDLSNLMLLCAACHKHIDDNPADFNRAILQGYKEDHEGRIRHVTGLGPDASTTILQLKALIAYQPVDIPIQHVYEAVAPKWPTDRHGVVIDISGISVEDDPGVLTATKRIDVDVRRLYADSMDLRKTSHISLFALAPMYLLMHLGSRLSNKIAVDFYQRHRDPEGGSPWRWRDNPTPVQYETSQLHEGRDPSKVALLLNLSGHNGADTLPDLIDSDFYVYELTLKGEGPNPDFLRSRLDLERFRAEYRTFLADLTRQHGLLSELHVFPAVPAPVAVVVGHDRLPKVHPDLVVYDMDKEHGFTFKLRIERDEH